MRCTLLTSSRQLPVYGQAKRGKTSPKFLASNRQRMAYQVPYEWIAEARVVSQILKHCARNQTANALNLPGKGHEWEPTTIHLT